jgi:hypothetical protein
MTEAEWLTCNDPDKMLNFLLGWPRTRGRRWPIFADPAQLREYLRCKASDRKLRLFACACCRRIWNLLDNQRSHSTVEVVEQVADGLLPAVERSKALRVFSLALHRQRGTCYPDRAEVWAVRFAANKVPAQSAWGAARFAAVARTRATKGPTRSTREYNAVKKGEFSAQANLLRDMFGSLPFHAVIVEDSWLAWNDGTVVKLAQGIYQDRAFDRLPILADALEDAGCTDADILTHCRGGGPHVRGCWALDLCLGKT